MLEFILGLLFGVICYAAHIYFTYELLVWTIITQAILLVLFVAIYRRLVGGRLDVKDRAVLITGCDTGIGHGLAKHLDGLGFTVFAGCYNANGQDAQSLRKGASERLHIVQLDVRSDEDVQKAVDYVKQNASGLWAVVNNAGVEEPGEVELCKMEWYYKIAEVNYFGIIRITKAFLPFIRKSKGRVLVVTSVKERMYLPANSAYVITKHAMGAFCDILRLEMSQWGVKVCAIEPGHFGECTKIVTANHYKASHDAIWESLSPELKLAYGKEYVHHPVNSTSPLGIVDLSATKLNKLIHNMTDALLEISPKERYLVSGYWFDIFVITVYLRMVLPTSLLDKIIMLIWQSNFPKPDALK
ncbi:unnamed protein product [Owenia fusiformis]|uniref:Uncharacterized protein n=1 Tax=Owenia fusiformis TaxID=6347 RepID=A0A8S4NRH6_OWEFU|nr:unnamed protein product [Owenia fusiformis]